MAKIYDEETLVSLKEPATVRAIGALKGATVLSVETLLGEKQGTLCAVRPVGDEKTHVGFLLGDLGVNLHFGYLAGDQVVVFSYDYNPALFVPELGRVIMGYECWWSSIKSEDQLREITNEDIENQWYVKVLRARLNAREEKQHDEKA